MVGPRCGGVLFRFLFEGLDGGVLGRDVFDKDLIRRLVGIPQDDGIVRRASYRTLVYRHVSIQPQPQVQMTIRYSAYYLARHHGDHLLFGHARKERMIYLRQPLKSIIRYSNSRFPPSWAQRDIDWKRTRHAL